jgi:hypothetical protein
LANGIATFLSLIGTKDKTDWYYIRIAGKYFGFVSAKYIKKV